MTSTADEHELDLLVRRMTWEAEGVLSVELSTPTASRCPPGPPARIWTCTWAAFVRQYSLCGDPVDATTIASAFSTSRPRAAVHATCTPSCGPGQTVRAAGPRNHFVLEPAASYVFIAGGIGITPILAMARQADRDGTPYRLVHGGRSRASMAFGGELAALGGDVTLVPQDERGHIDLAAVLADLPDRRTGLLLRPGAPAAAVEEAARPGSCAGAVRRARRRTHR